MSTNDPFARLALFIQRYIYQHRWADLREVQKLAIPAILDSNDHVLIMSGTASGKTEAAMLPVLTLLEQEPADSVGVLYIGPLKALINDQFERVQELLQEQEDIPIQGWHGDIAYSQKQRFLRQPRGILQITPESLEAMLINHPGELRSIFGDLRFIIIDEIHAFLGTERGQQVLCQLQRLELALRRPVRRIGLSATIGDKEMALRWLESSVRFQIPARLVEETAQGRAIELQVNHLVMAPERGEFQAGMAPDEIGVRRRGKRGRAMDASSSDADAAGQALVPAVQIDQRWELQQSSEDYYDALFALSMRHFKTLIFTNRRNRAEQIAAELRRRLANERPGRDWYFVHHSSIAANLRELAEDRMRDATQRACTIATASLELGIDIGHLDLTVQIDAPKTVSSFVQRLGRSGRRGTPSRMSFYTLEYLPDGETPPDLKQIPWNLLQTIAIVQLYLEERWIEPPAIPLMPLSLLYQQTLSAVQTRTELTPAQLAQAILTLSPFQAITQDEYRVFLRHLVASDQLAQMEEGTLIVGMKGARRTNHYSFYAIFADQQDCQVFTGTQEIGMIHGLPEVESVVGLAGYAWRVISVDERKRIVHVERAKGMVKANWINFSFASFHEHVMQRLRQVLLEDTMYTYLAPLAQQRLTLVRELARSADWLRSCVARLEPGRFVIFHWTGARIFRTLAHLLKHCDWHIELPRNGMYIEVIYDGDAGAVINELRLLSPSVAELVPELVKELRDSQLWQGKYDALAPRALLEEAYIHDVLDIPGTIRWLANCS